MQSMIAIILTKRVQGCKLRLSSNHWLKFWCLDVFKSGKFSWAHNLYRINWDRASKEVSLSGLIEKKWKDKNWCVFLADNDISNLT